MAENAERLRRATDARGRRLEVIELRVLPRTAVRGEPGVVPYVNLYVANGVVVVPTCGDDPDRDRDVLARLETVYPGREVVGVPGAHARRGWRRRALHHPAGSGHHIDSPRWTVPS